MTDPTDRSIPPLMMMSVMPIAAIPTETIWLAVERKVLTLRKRLSYWRMNCHLPGTTSTGKPSAA